MTASIDDTFRRAMRTVPSAVGVLLAHDGDEVRGATVTSFSSVAVDPPLLVVSVGVARRVHAALVERALCSLNVLMAGQEAAAQHFSSSVSRESGVQPVRLARSASGTPYLPGSLATFECIARPLGRYAAQELVMLEVADVALTDDDAPDPLLWHEGGPAYLQR